MSMSSTDTNNTTIVTQSYWQQFKALNRTDKCIHIYGHMFVGTFMSVVIGGTFVVLLQLKRQEGSIKVEHFFNKFFEMCWLGFKCGLVSPAIIFGVLPAWVITYLINRIPNDSRLMKLVS